ncbi:MAG: hypothetical protein ACREA8_08270 [Nitrosotalea sp.]
MSPNVLRKRMIELVNDGWVKRNNNGFRIGYNDIEEKKILDSLRIMTQRDEGTKTTLKDSILNLAKNITQNLENEREFLKKREKSNRYNCMKYEDPSRPDVCRTATLIDIIKKIGIVNSDVSITESSVQNYLKPYVNESIVGLYIRKTLGDTNVSWKLIKTSLPEKYWKIKRFADFWQLFRFMIKHDLELDDFDTIELDNILAEYGKSILETFSNGRNYIIKEILSVS